MSRDIKFRAWHSATSKMVDLYKITPFALNENIDGLFIPFSDDTPIMQYIGCKDKNGKAIYEGDIVKLKDHTSDTHMLNPDNYDFCVVKWKEEDCAFLPQDIQENAREGHYYHHWAFLTEVIVIGNIYENKDLIHEHE